MKRALTLGMLLLVTPVCFAQTGSIKAGAVGLEAAIPFPLTFSTAEIGKILNNYSAGVMWHITDGIVLNPNLMFMLASNKDGGGAVTSQNFFGLGLNVFFTLAGKDGFTLSLGPSAKFKMGLYEVSTHYTYMISVSAYARGQYLFGGKFGFFLNVGPAWMFYFNDTGTNSTAINAFLVDNEFGIVFYF